MTEGLAPLPSGKGIYLWNLSTCRGKLKTDQAIIDFIVGLGCKWVYMKIGNGWLAWAGLAPFIDRCHANGLLVGGFWYLYGNQGEREAIAKQASALNLDAFLFDAEGDFERSATPADKALAYVTDVRVVKPNLPLVLNSWWKPSAHPTQPFRTWLEHVDANMPQIYPMQDNSPLAPVWRLTTSLTEYRARGWSGPTLVAGAAFHESGWSSTVVQIDASHMAAIEQGCVGEAWWVLDQMLTDNNQAFLSAIRAHVWGPQPPTDAEKLAALWAWYLETHHAG